MGAHETDIHGTESLLAVQNANNFRMQKCPSLAAIVGMPLIVFLEKVVKYIALCFLSLKPPKKEGSERIVPH